MRRRWIGIGIVIAAVVAVSYVTGDNAVWERVSSDFMRDSKPYGPGDFRIRGDQVISMKLAKPEITFKPRTSEEIEDNARLEVTEPWMNNPGERANRRKVHILAGALGGEIEQRFEQPAQYADWWLAPDWSAIYLTTGWTDRTQPVVIGQQRPRRTQLFKSTDRGLNWQRLDWPEDQNITFLQFLDAERGYLIGWGPKIWRTEDGGEHWQALAVPEGARDPQDPRQQFDLVALGDDGVLRMAFYDALHDTSRVHALPWGETTSRLAFSLPQQTVMNLTADAQGQVYVLTQDGAPYFSLPADKRDEPRPSVVWRWQGGEPQHLHTFAPELTGYALYLTPSGHLLFDGIDESSLLGKGVTAVSDDEGQSWSFVDEGDAQGGYYDAQTGTRWRVSGYALDRRHIP